MRMTIINPEALGQPSGYSNGILFEGGSLLFIAGQVGWDRDRRIVSDDFAEQFAQALENVLAVVRDTGGEPANIARLLIFVTDKEEYKSRLRDVGSAYRQLMGKHFPAMALVEVSSLLEDLAKVEIEAVAVLPIGSQETEREARERKPAEQHVDEEAGVK
ncbi:MAG TPA: RidA family protein [Blastocatellia bacterium]|nr:RidA family protein [Blastocatellia bacterium]